MTTGSDVALDPAPAVEVGSNAVAFTIGAGLLYSLGTVLVLWGLILQYSYSPYGDGWGRVVGLACFIAASACLIAGKIERR